MTSAQSASVMRTEGRRASPVTGTRVLSAGYRLYLLSATSRLFFVTFDNKRHQQRWWILLFVRQFTASGLLRFDES